MGDRASKWKRKKNPDRLILQKRDREIIKAAFFFRVITREQLQKLLDFKCTRRINLRLRKLYDHRYLSRSFLPTIRGSGKAIYFLGPKGVEIISWELGEDPNLVKRKIRKISQLKELFLNHALELNNVRIAFSIAIQVQPEMKLERWINDNDCEQLYRVIDQGKEVVRKFRPDGYFRVWHRGRLYSFFLELDRATMTLSRFNKKIQTYFEFARLGFYQKRFGVKYFRVLVVVPTTMRLDSLKKSVEKFTDKVFWFSTLEEITMGKVLGQIWRKAGHQGLFPLIMA